MKFYTSLGVAGYEALAADPLVNLFTGRVYYNTGTNTVRIYNGAVWVDAALASAGSSFFTKFVGNDVGDFPNLLSALGSAVPGDRILVKKQSVEAAGDMTISVDNVLIDFVPGTYVRLNGALTSGLIIAASLVTIKNMRLEVSPNAPITDCIKITGPDCWIEGRFWTNGQPVTNLVNVSGVRGYSKLFHNGSTTPTNALVNTGTGIHDVYSPG